MYGSVPKVYSKKKKNSSVTRNMYYIPVND